MWEGNICHNNLAILMCRLKYKSPDKRAQVISPICKEVDMCENELNGS